MLSWRKLAKITSAAFLMPQKCNLKILEQENRLNSQIKSKRNLSRFHLQIVDNQEFMLLRLK